MAKKPPVHRHHHHHGLPPWHTVVTIVLLVLGWAAISPSIESLDQIATPDTFTHRIFPDLIPLKALILFRLSSCSIIFAWSFRALWIAFVSKAPAEIVTPYLPQSKLQRNVKISLRGWYSHAPFTMWSWVLLGISFGLNGFLACGRPSSPPTILLRTAVVLYEIVTPTTILVSAVVRYVIWPALLKEKGRGGNNDPSAPLKLPRVLAYHNLNVIFALVEATIMGGIPIWYSHISLAVYFGLIYVVFSWTIRNWWNVDGGPQFIYFFLDTTLGYTTTIAILVLLLALMVSYGVFCTILQVMDHLGGGIVMHTTAVVLLSSLVCRFRD